MKLLTVLKRFNGHPVVGAVGAVGTIASAAKALYDTGIVQKGASAAVDTVSGLVRRDAPPPDASAPAVSGHGHDDERTNVGHAHGSCDCNKPGRDPAKPKCSPCMKAAAKAGRIVIAGTKPDWMPDGESIETGDWEDLGEIGDALTDAAIYAPAEVIHSRFHGPNEGDMGQERPQRRAYRWNRRQRPAQQPQRRQRPARTDAHSQGASAVLDRVRSGYRQRTGRLRAEMDKLRDENAKLAAQQRIDELEKLDRLAEQVQAMLANNASEEAALARQKILELAATNPYGLPSTLATILPTIAQTQAIPAAPWGAVPVVQMPVMPVTAQFGGGAVLTQDMNPAWNPPPGAGLQTNMNPAWGAGGDGYADLFGDGDWDSLVAASIPGVAGVDGHASWDDVGEGIEMGGIADDIAYMSEFLGDYDLPRDVSVGSCSTGTCPPAY